MRTWIAIATLLSLGHANAQIRWEKQPVIADSDPAAPALKAWQQDKIAALKKEGLIVPTFTPWFELPFDSLRALLPGHRFFWGTWSEVRPPGEQMEAIRLPIRRDVMIVCDAKGKIVKDIRDDGKYEAFGEFLHSQKVTIRTMDDAKLVWLAFCDIHQRPWKSRPAVKVDAGKWHLGNETNKKFHTYYEVSLDSDSRVTGARMLADRVTQP